MSESERHVARVIALGVGGVVTRFESVEPDLALRVSYPRTCFVLDDDVRPDSAVSVRYGDPHPGREAPWFVSGGTWELHHGALGGDRVVFYTRVSDDGRAPIMRLDLSRDLNAAELVLARRYIMSEELELGFPLDEYLAARLLARRAATILHASCIVDGEFAMIFVGHSGAGKSTIARVAQNAGLQVLSDDRTVLIAGQEAVRAAGTPWHGSQQSGLPAIVPVGGFFLLQQSHRNRFTPMSQSRALGELLVRAVRPLASVEEQMLVLEALHAAVQTIPMGVLEFEPNEHGLAVARDLVATRIQIET